METRLRAGELKALVATASLELGIDIGPVELVCQIGSPRSIATFLQRVGRSNHSRSGTPKGRLFPLTRDELVECTALLAAVRAGRLDAIQPARLPLDIMAQQLVAEVAAKAWSTDDLYRSVRRAAPYTQLSRAQFDEVLDLVSKGIETGRGRRGAYLHHDAVNGELRPRKGARLAAATSGGAIPEVGDYRVLAEPDDMLVGSVNEDWAVESNAGDIFLLGTHSWQIRKVEAGRGAGPRRRRHSADGAVLERRGAGAHGRAVRRSLRTALPGRRVPGGRRPRRRAADADRPRRHRRRRRDA